MRRTRGDAAVADVRWRRVAAPPRRQRAYSVGTNRGCDTDVPRRRVAAVTQIDVQVVQRRVVATPRPRRGYSAERRAAAAPRRGCAAGTGRGDATIDPYRSPSRACRRHHGSGQTGGVLPPGGLAPTSPRTRSSWHFLSFVLDLKLKLSTLPHNERSSLAFERRKPHPVSVGAARYAVRAPRAPIRCRTRRRRNWAKS